MCYLLHNPWYVDISTYRIIDDLKFITVKNIDVKGELENRKKSEKLGPGNFAKRNFLKLYTLFREKLTKNAL